MSGRLSHISTHLFSSRFLSYAQFLRPFPLTPECAEICSSRKLSGKGCTSWNLKVRPEAWWEWESESESPRGRKMKNNIYYDQIKGNFFLTPNARVECLIRYVLPSNTQVECTWQKFRFSKVKARVRAACYESWILKYNRQILVRYEIWIT